MLNFDKSFFNDETICDFYVESMVKKAWASQLELLASIINVCKKYNITYYAFWGTMLGAVRHKGFIPWDDDIDIIMLRNDYDKFLEVAPFEFPDTYVVISPYTQVEWMEQFARITNSHSINYSENHLLNFHGFPFVTGIDIFPFDFVPNDPATNKSQMYLINLIVSTRELVLNANGYNNAIESRLVELENTFGFEFNRDVHLDNQLLCLFDQVSANFGTSSDSMVTCFSDRFKCLRDKKTDFLFKKDWFKNTVLFPFENLEISLPINYTSCLETCFGKDYMTPIIYADGHDYPFYKKQIEVLYELGRYDEVMNAVKEYDEKFLM